MNRLEKSLLDTDILSEIIKRANSRIIAKANTYLNQFDKYTSVITDHKQPIAFNTTTNK